MRCGQLILVLLMFSTSAMGQFAFKSFIGGTITNTSISILKGADRDKILSNHKYSSLYVPVIGFQFQGNLNKYLHVNTDFQCSFRGQNVENSYTSFKYELIYLDFIPSLNVNIKKHLSLGLGPYISSRIADYSDKAPYTYVVFSRKRDYGLNTTMHYVMNKISVRISYMYGMYHVFDAPFSPRFKHRSLQLSVGYTWWQKVRKNR